MALNILGIYFKYGKFFVDNEERITGIEWNSGKYQTVTVQIKPSDVYGPLSKYIKDNYIYIDLKIRSFFNVETTEAFVNIESINIKSIVGGKKRPALHKASKLLNHLKILGYRLEARISNNNMDQPANIINTGA